MTHARTVAIVLLALGLTPCSARAYHPLETDDAGTVEPGTAELELALAADLLAAEPPERQLESSLSLHLGLLPVLDLGGTFRFESRRQAEGHWLAGLADPTFDLKWCPVSSTPAGLGVAFRVDYEPPQSSALSSGGHDLGLTAILSLVRQTMDLHLNVGVQDGDVATDDRCFTLTLSSGIASAVTPTLRLGGEAVFERELASHRQAARGLAAAVWEPITGHLLSLGVGPSWETGSRVGVLVTVAITETVGG